MLFVTINTQQTKTTSLFAFRGLSDLSAAFDPVDHNVLLQRLHTSFGVHMLRWFALFLTGRSRTVVFWGTMSAYALLHFGVRSHGSVLSSTLLLLLYTVIAQYHNVSVHSYADDTQQLYTSCSAADGSESAARLLHCVDNINIT